MLWEEEGAFGLWPLLSHVEKPELAVGLVHLYWWQTLLNTYALQNCSRSSKFVSGEG
jgi:hypothetical protein